MKKQEEVVNTASMAKAQLTLDFSRLKFVISVLLFLISYADIAVISYNLPIISGMLMFQFN